VESTHQHAGHGHREGHAPSGNDLPGHTHNDQWHDEEYVKQWVERQKGGQDKRRRQFVALRAFMPKSVDQEFRYLNLGAGPGNLDTVLLEHFKGANAVVLDGSLAMLAEARKALAQYGDRVEYVQADLTSPDWAGAVAGPFDFVISSRTIHHLGEPKRIRALYQEIRGLTGHGGTFLNLDYVRPAKAELARLGDWISRDEEAGFAGAPHSAAAMPGTLIEHLGWLSEAGFNTAEVYWKEMDLALLSGINGHLHMPWGHGDDPEKAKSGDHGHGHGHGHGH
jgi:SAM-dependent methyltransferase